MSEIPGETVALITQLKAKWPVRVLCHLFGIHRSIYYAQVKRPVNVQRIELRSRVRAVHALSRGAVGSRAISQMLRHSGVDAGRWLARRLMRECGLTSRQPVKHHYRVNEDKSPPLPNLLNRQFHPAAPNRVWCGNISFIRLQDKWCYLALVVDLYSRRISKRTARAVLTGMCYSAGSAMRHGSSSLTRLTGQSAMTPSTWRR